MGRFFIGYTLNSPEDRRSIKMMQGTFMRLSVFLPLAFRAEVRGQFTWTPNAGHSLAVFTSGSIAQHTKTTGQI
jgi:hypothetical protein